MTILLMFIAFIAIDKVQTLLMLCQAGETQTAVKKQKTCTKSLAGRSREKKQHPDRENVTV